MSVTSQIRIPTRRVADLRSVRPCPTPSSRYHEDHMHGRLCTILRLGLIQTCARPCLHSMAQKYKVVVYVPRDDAEKVKQAGERADSARFLVPSPRALDILYLLTTSLRARCGPNRTVQQRLIRHTRHQRVHARSGGYARHRSTRTEGAGPGGQV